MPTITLRQAYMNEDYMDLLLRLEIKFVVNSSASSNAIASATNEDTGCERYFPAIATGTVYLRPSCI